MFAGSVPWRIGFSATNSSSVGLRKVVPALEDDVLMHKLRVLLQMRAQTCHVTSIDQVDRAAKRCVFNALVMGQVAVDRRASAFRCASSVAPSWGIQIRARW